MQTIDLSTAEFGTVIWMDQAGVAERGVVIVACRAQAPGVIGRRPAVHFENPRIGRKDIMDVATPAFGTKDDCADAIKAGVDMDGLREAIAALPPEKLQSIIDAAAAEPETPAAPAAKTSKVTMEVPASKSSDTVTMEN